MPEEYCTRYLAVALRLDRVILRGTARTPGVCFDRWSRRARRALGVVKFTKQTQTQQLQHVGCTHLTVKIRCAGVFKLVIMM